MKDRYRNLGPFRHTQVKLRDKSNLFASSGDGNQEFDSDSVAKSYMNANIIRSAKLRNLFIATQGPQENTFLNFWRMVWQEKVSLIVMLCPLQEDKKIKCAEYWPNENAFNGELNIEDKFKISYIKTRSSSSSVINNCSKIRELKILNIEKNEERSLLHYNFLTWPDFGTPEESHYEVIEDIISKISQIDDDERNKSKVVVHCSAGIGRTGTLIAIYNLVSTIQHYIDTKNTKKGRISVFATVRRLREQRYHMVHNELQYEFIYHFIHHWFNLKNIDDSN